MKIHPVIVIFTLALAPLPARAETTAPQTFAFETYAGRAYNCLENMPDKEGMPYFHIFWTDPAEAGHAGGVDSPDVCSRMWEAAIMARHMTGRTCSNEKAFAKNTLRFLSPETGLAVPGTGFLGFAQGVSLHAITTAYADSKDPALLDLIRKTVDNLPSTFENKDQWRAVPIKSLMNCARLTNDSAAADYAGKLIHGCSLLNPNNKKFGGHMHAGLRILSGAADDALYMKDAALFDQVNAIYQNVQTIPGARFGWLPESSRGDDLVGCESCAVMDFVSLATTLANNGHPEYWGNVERIVRNQLAENQVVDGSWLKPGDKPDTANASWRDVGSRMAGGFAGWSSPTHILAYREDDHGRTRAFQNCCAGSGVHAFYIAWKSASRFENGVLSVNMHIDKLLPQAEIRCYQPYQGYLSVALKEACKVRVRVPDFVDAKDIKVSSNKGEGKMAVENGYLELGPRQAGEKIEVTYPVPVKEEEIAIGNPKGHQYHYRVTWKGDTVVRMTPIGEQYKTAYSEGMKKEVECFYGEEGPGRLYQREEMLKDVTPALAPLHADDGSIDFWLLRAGS
ncbi:MAG: hypothetical protein WCS31_11140 [Verrucomicrobiae bacterium]